MELVPTSMTARRTVSISARGYGNADKKKAPNSKFQRISLEPGVLSCCRHVFVTFQSHRRQVTMLVDVQSKPKMASFGPAHFINRELSWLEFNQRVLDQALDPANPLLERMKFFCITSSNLDEFFEVRVAGIKQQIEAEVSERSIDGLTPSQTFRAINRRVQKMVDDQ